MFSGGPPIAAGKRASRHSRHQETSRPFSYTPAAGACARRPERHCPFSAILFQNVPLLRVPPPSQCNVRIRALACQQGAPDGTGGKRRTAPYLVGVADNVSEADQVGPSRRLSACGLRRHARGCAAYSTSRNMGIPPRATNVMRIITF